MKFVSLLFLVIATGCGSGVTPSSSFLRQDDGFFIQRFSVHSRDHDSTIGGQITFPLDNFGRQPLVVMVPGTGLFDRDVLFGNSGSDRDFIFRDLELGLLREGIAVLRMDYRGVRCSLRTMPACPSCQTDADRFSHYVSQCIDTDLRSRVTPQTIRADLKEFFDTGRYNLYVDKDRVAIFSHSEGTIHISELVGSGEIKPVGLVYMGMVAESPQGVLRWQLVDRFMRILNWDGDDDGALTNAEVHRGYEADAYFAQIGYPVDTFLSPSGSWTEASLRQHLTEDYEREKAAALAADDDEPYGSPVTFSSYGWWKMWFQDNNPVAASLCNYSGKLMVHNGGIDSQTPAAREFAAAEEALAGCPLQKEFVTHAGEGHTLSPHPLMGPVDDEAKAKIVADFKAMLVR